MIRLKFKDAASRDAFADRFKLDGKVDAVELDVEFHFMQFAKLDDNCVDYDDLTSNAEQEFIVKGDPAKFDKLATVVADMGNGFYHVKSTEGTILGDFVDSIEHLSAPVKYLSDDIYIDEMNHSPSTVDPLSDEGQWPRLRVISRYRPLATKFNLHELIYKSKPEVIIMDSGVNFNHPELSHISDKEDFYTLPAFNGDFRDDVGHGTGLAGLIAGKNLGIAENIKLVNVKIGSKAYKANLLDLGQAIDAILNRVTADPTVTRIVNMSWGIPRSSWLDSKIESLLTAGVTVIAAAGNQGISVEDISPAGINDVITVGSIDKYDIPSGFNNISPTDSGVTTGSGLSLDLFAPGDKVLFPDIAGGYAIGSGTSMAAAVVSGTAAAMASLYSTMMPYAQLKHLLVNTATPDALLFEDDRFSENQNKLIYFAMADNNGNAKENDLLSYLGPLSEANKTIIVNTKSSLNVDSVFNIFGEPFTYEVKFLDSAHEKYRPYFDIADTGKITITWPHFTMPEEVKLVMVQFTVTAKSPTVNLETPILFFYDTNEKYKDTLESDVTLALTDTNSISFYAAWGSLK